MSSGFKRISCDVTNSRAETDSETIGYFPTMAGEDRDLRLALDHTSAETCKTLGKLAELFHLAKNSATILK